MSNDPVNLTDPSGLHSRYRNDDCDAGTFEDLRINVGNGDVTSACVYGAHGISAFSSGFAEHVFFEIGRLLTPAQPALEALGALVTLPLGAGPELRGPAMVPKKYLAAIGKGDTYLKVAKKWSAMRFRVPSSISGALGGKVGRVLNALWIDHQASKGVMFLLSDPVDRT